MKKIYSLFFTLLVITTAVFLNSCKKQNLFRSESEIRKSLMGTWNLIPIPLKDTLKNSDGSYNLVNHVEAWTFSDARVDIVWNGRSGYSSFTVKTTPTKAEFNITEMNTPPSDPLSHERYEGTWQIVRLDDDILAIANDKEGTSGLLQLEFQKKK